MADVLKTQRDVFIDELRLILDKTDVEKDRALSILWSMINISLLDYFDDNGDILPVRELKKLPRIYQIMLTEIDVQSYQHPVTDKEGKVMCDDNGSPYLRTETKVKLKLPDKQSAMNQLAQIMRWVGPSTVINNNTVNIGSMMVEADARRGRAEIIYEGAARSVE